METGGSKGVEVCSSLIEKQDLVVEFLSRLPVKSLCRFRCVSKEWDALIKSSYFMALHHSLSPNLSLILGSYLFFDNSFFVTCDYQVSSLCVEEDTPILKSISPLPQLMHRTKASIDIAASINGLVLLRSISWCKDFGLFDEDIIVWNPATTKLRYLPKHLDSKCSSDHVRVVLGFGFINGIGSEYKVVRIWPTPNNVDGKSTYKTLVFTQGTDSWRQAQACIPTCAHKCLIQCSSSTTLNGELYFCAINSERYVDCVLSYNLRDEVFKVVTLPSNLPNSSMYLHSWNNSLALVTREVVSRERDGWANVVCRYSSKAEVWVMRNKESAQSCWEIQFTIPTEISVLGFLKDKILHFAYHNDYRRQSGDLLMHDPQSLKDRNLSTHVGGVQHRPFRLVPYVETLFPVDG